MDIPAGGWGPIKCMAANIRFDDPKDGENGWTQRRELVVKTFLKNLPTVIGCQEVLPAQGAYLRKQLGQWYDYYPRGGVGAAATESRSAAGEILSALDESMASLNTIFFRSDRFEIVDGEAGLVVPEQPQGVVTENTFVTIGVLRERGGESGDSRTKAKTLIVVDEHFRHGEPFALQCAARVEQKIAGWMKKYPGSGVVLLGDMNWDRTSKLYASLTAEHRQDADVTGVPQLTDLFDYAKLQAAGGASGANAWGTYHAFTGVPQQKWPTDLIFYGGALQVETPTEIVRDKGADGRWPSDHYFVMGAVKF